MKVTLSINGEDVEVTLTPEQLASIEAQKKPKQFEFKYVKWHTYCLQEARLDGKYSGDSPAGLEHGRYRITKEVAERSMARNKRANRLEAVAEQLGGLEEWSTDFCRATIFFEGDNWQHSYYVRDEFQPERVYMTEDCAIEICRMLNAGEFEL